MCGRYASSRSDTALRQEFTVAETVGQELPPSWNVAPTQPIRAVLERAPRDQSAGEPVRQLRSVRWGLVPSWAKDITIGNRLINARVETITEKPAFKAAAARRRCLIPADGYYEWEKRAGQRTKVPYFLRDLDGQTLALAGLYELWPDPTREHDDPDRWLWSAVSRRRVCEPVRSPARSRPAPHAQHRVKPVSVKTATIIPGDVADVRSPRGGRE